MTHQTYDHDVDLKVSIPNSLDRAVEEAAFRQETTKKAIVQQALRDYFKGQPRTERRPTV